MYRTCFAGSSRRRTNRTLKNGDIISVDIPGKELNVELSDAEIKSRLNSLPPFDFKIKKGYLARYAQMVTSASTGAVLKTFDFE